MFSAVTEDRYLKGLWLHCFILFYYKKFPTQIVWEYPWHILEWTQVHLQIFKFSIKFTFSKLIKTTGPS